MTVTPSELFALALSRHRQPWNFTVQLAALALFGLALLLHSFLVFAAGLILFGFGFFELPLPEMSDGRWRRVVQASVEWEKNWSVLPWTFAKWAGLCFVLLACCLLVWALWTRDLAVLALFVAFGYLARVVAENRAGGIDP
ncbi:hypothetical protein GKC30_08575 [Pseudodesulfovibrio sp. F-1]|uniref:Uncharacterized protein n=1 Tax=Pseudodesulfovibrio alkaliphilus TaxID=2661613 RepID=A0A7K1KNL1_9BACT|nr:hypothetical protein [Pseudodesulfovibrio alkaliphilus]MUM77686.1 hypothetical protein [Pseudodesulfovibrio alkaliphilus]